MTDYSNHLCSMINFTGRGNTLERVIRYGILLFCIALGGAGCQSANTNTAPANTNKSITTSPSPVSGITQPQTPGSWVNIPGLADKTPEEIENSAGKATDVAPVTEPPQEMPGENRTYDLADMKGALSVRFYKGKAVAFTVSVPKGKELKTAAELAKMAGFDVTGKEPAKGTEFVSQWNGQFGPAKFAEVTIGKTATKGYNLVRARIQQ